jgi:hypothetical protein
MALARLQTGVYTACHIHLASQSTFEVFDIAAQLWGRDIFAAFYDCPKFLREALDLIAETYIRVCRTFAAASTEGMCNLIHAWRDT